MTMLAFFLTIALALLPLLFLASSLYTSMSSIISINIIPPGANDIPAFYSPSTQSDRHAPTGIMGNIRHLCVIFGAMHCIAWDFIYPTQLEQSFGLDFQMWHCLH